MKPYFFEDQFLKDERKACLSLEVFGLVFNCLMPSLEFYFQLITLFVIQMFFGCLLGVVTYYGVVVPQQEEIQRRKDSSSTTKKVSSSSGTPLTSASAYLICYGIVVPISLYYPFPLINYFDIRSPAIRMGCIFLPMNFPFRCLEAMYGYTPNIEHITLRQFVQYSGFNMIPLYRYKDCNDQSKIKDDGKNVPNDTSKGKYILNSSISKNHSKTASCDSKNGFEMIPVTWKEQAKSVLRFCKFLVYAGIGLSLSLPILQQQKREQQQELQQSIDGASSYSYTDISITFNIRYLFYTYVQAAIVNLLLCMGFYGNAIVAIPLSGILYHMRLTDWPMFCATSPSDFWGRKWNNLIHYALKQGIYKPVRLLTNNQLLATLSAFVVSGLMHEYIWYLIFFGNIHQKQDDEDGNICYDCYDGYRFGKQMIFFTWNGMLLFLEYTTFIGTALKSLNQNPYVPKLIITLSVVLMALPVGHLFTGDLFASDFYTKMSIALPLITVAKKQ